LPELVYVPPPEVALWAEEKTNDEKSAPPEVELRRLMRLRDELLKAFADAKVVLLGSDAPQTFAVPGFSLRAETQAMQSAGMTPWQIVESATIAPARFLGFEEDSGTIEVGKRADLLLLDGNPLVDVANIFRSSGVMLAGRWIGRAELDSMLADVAKQARTAVKDVAIDEKEMLRLIGTYDVSEIRVQIDVERRDGTLVVLARDAHGTQTFRLRSQGDGAFRIPEIGARVTFDFQNGRVVAMVLAQHGGEIRAERRR
jgi:hypothetical protein